MNEVTLIAIASAAIGVTVGVLLNIHEAKARVVTKAKGNRQVRAKGRPAG